MTDMTPEEFEKVAAEHVQLYQALKAYVKIVQPGAFPDEGRPC